MMREMFRLVLTVTLFGAMAGLLLAFTNQRTRGRIEYIEQQVERRAALAAVLPPFDNDPFLNPAVFTDKGVTWRFWIARRNGAPAGIAFESESRRGYAGPVRILTGLNPDATLCAVQVLQQTETPGLGALIAQPGFLKRLQGLPLDRTVWRLKKEGGDVVGITGATISSRALTEAVSAGAAAYLRHREELTNERASQ
jgi:electron transport complex protein RnfG